ncbi:helix-turn-helix domain-containing protein [Fictibacillus sp. 7GRE50]|uniref:AimR family lysis-lysogeny pheromone receptor n=1 Tax=Fictibacillus sp. 7GRE50 TaxID=2745878 RepID=UPI0018CE9A74|nr:AimR family lysis-lysogeny pheromone receptor [Fictibacillus sp. 7GRE50]MBH0167160.1 helix-turn-helix domain-containing protein [Fictibacillus sp. 7GRE50]
MKKLGYNQSQLASMLDVNRSTISRFFEHGQEISFDKMILMSKILHPFDQLYVMEQYTSTLKQSDNILMALEYTSVNRMSSSNKKLLQSVENTFGSEDEFFKVYTDYAKSRNGKLSDEDILYTMRTRIIENESMNILQRIMGMYVFYRQEKYDVLLDYSREIQNELSNFSCEYLYSSFLARISEPLAFTSLKVYADFDKARKYSMNIVNNQYVNEPLAASAYYNLGMSYIFDSYDKCIEAFNKSIEIYSHYNNKGFEKNTKNFAVALVNLLYNKFDNFKSTDPVLNAYYYSKIGDKSKAIDFLSDLQGTLCSEAMIKFVAGVVTEDDKLLWDSLSNFISDRDMWMSILPCLELIRKGEEPHKVYAGIKPFIFNFKEVEKFEKNFIINTTITDNGLVTS